MAKNKIEDLRNLMFETIERLMDGDSSMNTADAQAIANLGKVIVETAKVEVQFMKEVGGIGTGFVPTERNELDDRLKEKALTAGNS